MGFRVVDKSFFAIETDLSPSRRNIHPSGVLHAFREDVNEDGSVERQNIFVWVVNSLHVEYAIKHLENKCGIHRHNVVFIPYSTKEHWRKRYPTAEIVLECLSAIGEAGKMVACNNNEAGADAGVGGAQDVPSIPQMESHASVDVASSSTPSKHYNGWEKTPYRRKSQAKNMVRNNTLLPDAERDELHLEIWNYLSWLHARLTEVEEAEAAKASAAAQEDDDYVNYLNKRGRNKPGPKKGKPLLSHGVELDELKNVVDKLETAFLIIPNVKRERAKEAKMTRVSLQSGTAGRVEDLMLQREEEGEEEEDGDDEQQQSQSSPAAAADSAVAVDAEQNNEPPFLEEALSSALTQLVTARELCGKKRRSRKRPRRDIESHRKKDMDWYNRGPGDKKGFAPRDFDEMFERLAEFHERHGHCLVRKGYKDDLELAHWVRGIRERKVIIRKKGWEWETIPPDGRVGVRTLTSERVSRLDGIGFAWTIITAEQKVPWEDRFQEMMEYYDENGKWPTQSMGRLGQWVHRQRGMHAKKDANYIQRYAQRLDEVGFEWAPRGPRNKARKMSWDEEEEGV